MYYLNKFFWFIVIRPIVFKWWDKMPRNIFRFILFFPVLVFYLLSASLCAPLFLITYLISGSYHKIVCVWGKRGDFDYTVIGHGKGHDIFGNSGSWQNVICRKCGSIITWV